jgi:uncharacterized protein (DUF2384 family)
MAKLPGTEKQNTPIKKAPAEYIQTKRLPAVTDFPFRKFSKIAEKVPFTQKEWANILHLSERTLQRYAKDNSSFDGIYVDRILLLEQLLETGLETFIDSTALYNWLKKEKIVLGNKINFESLYSSQGINDIIDQLGRIQYGVYT